MAVDSLLSFVGHSHQASVSESPGRHFVDLGKLNGILLWWLMSYLTIAVLCLNWLTSLILYLTWKAVFVFLFPSIFKDSYLWRSLKGEMYEDYPAKLYIAEMPIGLSIGPNIPKTCFGLITASRTLTTPEMLFVVSTIVLVFCCVFVWMCVWESGGGFTILSQWNKSLPRPVGPVPRDNETFWVSPMFTMNTESADNSLTIIFFGRWKVQSVRSWQ